MRGDAWWIAALLRLYPRAYRAHHEAGLRAAMLACFDREREGGSPRVLTALRLAVDAASASWLVRRDLRRARRVVHPHRPPGVPPMQSLAYDIRHALRLLRRSPLFSILVIGTFALAIGANTAIFSIVNGVLLRGLPFAQPERLVFLYEGISSERLPFGFSAPDFLAFRERARSYEALAVFRSIEVELSGVDVPERVSAAKISASLPGVLGVGPALGRAFTVEEDTGRQPVAILSDGLWRRKFGADPAIAGKSVALDRRAYTVVGVMPSSFTFPNRGPHINNVPADVYVPISFTDQELQSFGSMYNNTVVGRLKPGVSQPQAAAEATALARQMLAEVYPANLRDLGLSLTATVSLMRDNVVGNVGRSLYVLLAAVGVLLLIACADIACLTLTRTAARERELAIRTALGAGRGRVMRLLLIETGVLAATGGAAGLALAWWAQRALLAAAPISIPRAQEIAIDGRVLAFTLAAAAVAALIAGLLPALESSRRQAGTALKEGGRTGSATARQRRIFAGLVIAQFALAVVLVSAGGLVVRSFIRLTSTDPGFDGRHVLSAAVSLPANTYPKGADVRRFYVDLLQRVQSLPGIEAAGASTDLPLSVRERRAFAIEAPSEAAARLPHVLANDWVTGDYFGALGSRVVKGRALSAADTAVSEPVVVVNETLASRYWPGEDPVGRRIAWGSQRDHGRWMRIVGIVADVKQAGLAAPTEPETWQPWLQVPDESLGENVVGIYRGLKLMVRSALPPSTLVPMLRAQVRALDPALPVTGVQTLGAIVGASAGPQRFNAALIGGFAGVALLLAAMGIGGVLAISVSRRTQEIGVRLALGAHPRDVVRMVVGQGMLLVGAGLLLGLPCAFAAARLLRSLLFETAPYDALSFAGATVVLCGVALAACAAPALRASRVSPVTALRID